MKTQFRILAAAVVLALAPVVQAQTPTTPSELNSGQNHVATRIANNFTNFAGGEENSLALVNGLRAGGDVTLVTVVPPPEGSPPGTLPTTTETIVAVPTKPMGWGNVKHSLALARDQLQRAGITNPTAEQLQTALNGGDLVRVNADGTTTTTSVRGVLTMRADGMGWGNIAKAGGTKLGHVQKVDMSGRPTPVTTPTPTPTPLPATTTAKGVTTAAGTTTTTPKAKGITTAAGGSTTVGNGNGKSKGITTAAGGAAVSVDKGPSKGITTATGATSTHGSKGLVTASGASANATPNGNAHGRGIVTAAGGTSTNVAAVGNGKGNAAASSGVVTASGGAVSSSGVTHGGGNAGGNGNGKGGDNGKGKGG